MDGDRPAILCYRKTAVAFERWWSSSLAFMTPLGHPVNILVMGPGGYKFSDFWRVGLWLTVILIITILALMALS